MDRRRGDPEVILEIRFRGSYPMDLRVVVYERQILPLCFRELRGGCRIEFRRRLNFYFEKIIPKPICNPDLQVIHVAVEDRSQWLFVRTIKVIQQFFGVRARALETRERD